MITSRPKFVTEEHLVFLDELRESGKTNMFGARPFIEDEFPEMPHDEAGVLLTYWMRSFTVRQTAEYFALVRDRGSQEIVK